MKLTVLALWAMRTVLAILGSFLLLGYVQTLEQPWLTPLTLVFCFLAPTIAIYGMDYFMANQTKKQRKQYGRWQH